MREFIRSYNGFKSKASSVFAFQTDRDFLLIFVTVTDDLSANRFLARTDYDCVF